MTSGDACPAFALNQKNEITLGKKKQELLIQARSQAGAWEREKRENNNARLPFSLSSKKLSNSKFIKGDCIGIT